MEKRDVIKYLVVGLIFVGLVGLLLVLTIRMTGFAVYYEGPGEGQTTLMLQVADVDNLEDAYVDKSTPNRNHGDKDYLKIQRVTWQRAYLKFNISTIPSGQIIDDASLCLFLDNDQGTQNISINHVYNDSWCEGDGGTDATPSCEITWNNQPCGTEDENLNSSNCNITSEDFISTDTTLDDSWQCWNIVNMVKQEYNSNNENISVVLWTIDTGNADIFHNKEYTTDVNLRPYLNITYHTANTAPSITLDYPQQGATYGYNESLDLDFSAFDSDDNLDSCWYNIDGGVNVSLANCANTTFDVSGDGDYVLNVYVNDTQGEEASDSASFSVQVGAPTIVLHFPVDEYLDYQENIQFNYTPTDIDLGSCELWGDFGGNFSLNQTDDSPTSGSVNSFNLNLSDGTYLWNIKCNDSVGNSAVNGNKTFYVDTVSPNVSLSEPSGAKTSRTISASWSVSDDNLDSCWYNVYRGESLEIGNTSVGCSTNSSSFEVTVDADFVFNFYVNDSAGNSNSVSSSFSVDTSSSPSPPSGGGGGGGGSSRTTVIISNETKKANLQVLKIGNIIAREGDRKTLSLNAKNTGNIFLNNCKLIVLGDISSWIYSTKISGIAPGESIDFAFDLNVPEETQAGDYSGKLEIKCNEENDVQNIVVSLPGLSSIIVKDIEQEGKLLTIVYEIDNSNLIGDTASVDVWLEDSDGYEITRFNDVFGINKDGLIERNVEMELENVAGIYYIYLAFSDDLSDFVRESIVLGEPEGTGFVVFDTTKGKIGVYIVFLLIMAVAVFFIWRRHGKTKHSKSKWFFGKKHKK